MLFNLPGYRVLEAVEDPDGGRRVLVEPVESVVPDPRDDVDAGQGPVALQGRGPDPAGGDVVEVLGHPDGERRRGAGAERDAGIPSALQGADLGHDLTAGGATDVAPVAAPPFAQAHGHIAVPAPTVVLVDRGLVVRCSGSHRGAPSRSVVGGGASVEDERRECVDG